MLTCLLQAGGIFKPVYNLMIWETSFQINKCAHTHQKLLLQKPESFFSSLSYSGWCFDVPFPLWQEDSCLWDLGSSCCNNCKQSELERLNVDVTKSPGAHTSTNASEHYKIQNEDSRFIALFFFKGTNSASVGVGEGREPQKDKVSVRILKGSAVAPVNT